MDRAASLKNVLYQVFSGGKEVNDCGPVRSDVRLGLRARILGMKTYLFSLVPVIAVSVLLDAPTNAAPSIDLSAPVYTNTDRPNLAPIEGTVGQTDSATLNDASPTGAVKNMAPIRGKAMRLDGFKPGDSASGLTIPGASSGSSLGSGSNSTLPPSEKTNEVAGDELFSD